MSMRRLIWGFLVCFSMAVFMGQALSQTRRAGRTRERSEISRLRNMDQKQRQQELEQHRLKQQIERQLKQISPDKSEKELMQQVLRATEEQWKAIEPKVNEVRRLRNRANVSIRMIVSGSMGGGSIASGIASGSARGSSVDVNVDVNKGVGRGSMFGGTGTLSGGQKRGSAGGSLIHYGWGWVRPSRHKGFENLNEGEKICEELFRLLEDKNSELEEIRQKMEALRKFRQEAKKELAIAQQELRELVTPHQEAALVMMQLLD
jgi:hypothetical protein